MAAKITVCLKRFKFAACMRFNSLLLLLISVVITAVLMFSGSGCASIVPPSGGPRDSLPPVIIEVDPPNETTNFNAKEINIKFDEYIELEDVYKNLIISPLPKIYPDVTRKLKTVTVKIKDTLQPNTTYVYNFANVIKDLHEGNRGKDLLYVVSTGTYFDSLQLSGVVRMANTGKPDSTLTIMLHNNLEDSAVARQRPRYITRVDSSGTFLFRYLAPGKYNIYAMKDDGGSYLYNGGEQVFAFADSPVVVSQQPPTPVILWAYAGEKEREDVEEEELDKKEKRLKYQTNLEGAKQDLLQAFTMTFPSPLKNFDTTKIFVSVDSTFRPPGPYKISLDSTRKVMTLNTQWLQDTLYNIILEKEFASDSLDRTIFRKDTIQFTTKATTDYGQVKITFLDVDMSLNPVLQILQGGNIKNSFAIPANRIVELQLYNPGEYEMQILYDRNKNLKWDPGAFFKGRIQPERIETLQRKLVVKPNNWGTEFEVRMAR